MQRYHFYQVDVFTRQPFGGNQLAVFIDGQGLDTAQMQDLAREMNYSETTFVLPPVSPGAQKKVRIFTPAIEMPMAGHPTVGTAALLVHLGLVKPEENALTLDLGIGPVQVDLQPGGTGLPYVWMNHRLPDFGPVRADRGRVAAALGLAERDLRADLPMQVVSTGVPFLFVPVASLEAIRRAQSETGALARLFENEPRVMIALFTSEVVQPEARFHSRMFAPHVAGIVEDPATGSMAAPFGAYTARHGLLPDQPEVTFLMEQGLEMGRPSQITVSVSRERSEITALRIGGDSVLVGEGDIFW